MTEITDGSDRLPAVQKKLLAAYSFGHFMTDLICAFGMISLILCLQDRDQIVLLLFLYNFCAFALQMPVGLMADYADRNSVFAVFGLVLTASVLLLPVYHFPVVFAVLLGIGNCCFHVGGGTDVLHFRTKKQWPLGVFVSPGAFGLFLGTLAAKMVSDPLQSLLSENPSVSIGGGFVFPDSFSVLYASAVFLAPAVVLVSAVIVFSAAVFYLSPPGTSSGNGPVDIRPVCAGTKTVSTKTVRMKTDGAENVSTKNVSTKNVSMGIPLAALILFVLVVILRSYAGMTFSFSWKTGLWAFAVVAGVVLGKTCGGFLADRFGTGRTSFVTLLFCAFLFLFPDNPVCGTLAVFLFNMTMPLTLFETAKMFPNARGFAFGILTTALFIGFLPILAGFPEIPLPRPVFYASEALVSMIFLLTGLYIAGGKAGVMKTAGRERTEKQRDAGTEKQRDAGTEKQRDAGTEKQRDAG
ncbi:MFS transporter, partial [Methanosarcinaceae archaeon]|nr:MFS transporter [Methanosarcinaceae archaeon]